MISALKAAEILTERDGRTWCGMGRSGFRDRPVRPLRHPSARAERLSSHRLRPPQAPPGARAAAAGGRARGDALGPH